MERRRKVLSCALTSVIALFATCACNNKSEPVVITVDPPKVQIDKKKIENYQKNAPASDHEMAQTDWLFSISPEVLFSVKDEKKEKDGYHIWIEVTGIHLKLGLPITTTISEEAPKYVVDHENGHVKICTRIYENARNIAQKSAENVLGKTVEGFGADKKLAISNALQMVAQDIAAPYRVGTVGLADVVSSNYDQLCEKEERKDLVEKTIEDAFAAAGRDVEKKHQSPQKKEQSRKGNEAPDSK